MKKRYGLLLTQQNGTDREFPLGVSTQGMTTQGTALHGTKRKRENDAQKDDYANKKARWDEADRKLKEFLSDKKNIFNAKNVVNKENAAKKGKVVRE